MTGFSESIIVAILYNDLLVKNRDLNELKS